jgi:hypothetical protein
MDVCTIHNLEHHIEVKKAYKLKILLTWKNMLAKKKRMPSINKLTNTEQLSSKPNQSIE